MPAGGFWAWGFQWLMMVYCCQSFTSPYRWGETPSTSSIPTANIQEGQIGLSSVEQRRHRENPFTALSCTCVLRVLSSHRDNLHFNLQWLAYTEEHRNPNQFLNVLFHIESWISQGVAATFAVVLLTKENKVFLLLVPVIVADLVGDFQTHREFGWSFGWGQPVKLALSSRNTGHHIDWNEDRQEFWGMTF